MEMKSINNLLRKLQDLDAGLIVKDGCLYLKASEACLTVR